MYKSSAYDEPNNLMLRKVKLAYCTVEGEIHHVSKFAGIPVRARPKATCPECKGPIILKLSKSLKPVPHAAHSPDSTCPLTNPETALHFNTKVYIYNQLKNVTKLYLPQFCNGWKVPVVGPYPSGHRACTGRGVRHYTWLENWTSVELERYVGNRKPDIVFYRNNTPIAALEIRATHAVDTEKIIDFQIQNLPWVEVTASEETCFHWKPYKFLPFVSCSSTIPAWTCNHCLEAPARYTENIERLLEKESDEKLLKKRAEYEREQKRLKYLNSFNHIVKAKIVCFFRPDGSRDYHELHICERYETKFSNEIVELYLRDQTNNRILFSEEPPLTEKSKKNITDYYKHWLSINSHSAEISHVTKWTCYDEMKHIQTQWISPYTWDTGSNQWISRQYKQP